MRYNNCTNFMSHADGFCECNEPRKKSNWFEVFMIALFISLVIATIAILVTDGNTMDLIEAM